MEGIVMKLYIIKFRAGRMKFSIRVYARDLEKATQAVREMGGEPYALVMTNG